MAHLCILTDTHFGEKNQNQRFYEYYKRFLDNVFFPTIQKYNIKHILHGGDLFHHRQSIDIRTWRWTQENFLDPLERMGVNIYGIVGNHDIYYKSSSTLNSPQELLKQYPNFNFVQEPTTITFENVKILMLPWIHNYNMEIMKEALQQTDAEYVLSHLELAGFQMHPGVYAESGLGIENLLQRFKTVWSGHYHTQSKKANIHYLGAPVEFNWNDWNDTKGFHVFDTNTEQMTFIKNPEYLHHKVYLTQDGDPIDAQQYEDKIVRLIITEKVKRAKIDATVAALNDHCWDLKVVDHGLDEIVSDAENADYGEGKSTLEIIEETVKETDTELDQDRLAYLIKTLYTEAEAIR